MSEETKQIQVKVQENHQPSFANSVQINVSDEEVALQFLYVRRNTNQATLVSEIILTPKHAVTFGQALDKTIKQHVTKHLPK